MKFLIIANLFVLIICLKIVVGQLEDFELDNSSENVNEDYDNDDLWLENGDNNDDDDDDADNDDLWWLDNDLSNTKEEKKYFTISGKIECSKNKGNEANTTIELKNLDMASKPTNFTTKSTIDGQFSITGSVQDIPGYDDNGGLFFNYNCGTNIQYGYSKYFLSQNVSNIHIILPEEPEWECSLDNFLTEEDAFISKAHFYPDSLEIF